MRHSIRFACFREALSAAEPHREDQAREVDNRRGRGGARASERIAEKTDLTGVASAGDAREQVNLEGALFGS